MCDTRRQWRRSDQYAGRRAGQDLWPGFSEEGIHRNYESMLVEKKIGDSIFLIAEAMTPGLEGK